jgi:hypothetical protein
MTEAMRFVVGQQAQVGGLRRAREEDLPDIEDRQRAAAPVDRDGRMGVMRQAVVVEVGVRQDDGGEGRRAGIAGVESQDVAQDTGAQQFGGGQLRGVEGVVRPPLRLRGRPLSSAAKAVHRPRHRRAACRRRAGRLFRSLWLGRQRGRRMS